MTKPHQMFLVTTLALALLIGLSACGNHPAQPDNLETAENMPAYAQEEFEVIGEFVDGVARIRYRTGVLSHYGLIDIDGNILVELIYASISEFVDGVAIVRERGRGSGLIDIRGNIVLEPELIFINDIVDGFAVVYDNNNKFGLVSIDGSWVLEPTFDGHITVGEFVDGVARISHEFRRNSRHYGLLDTQGNVLVQPIYDSISEFVDGVAIVRGWGIGTGLIDTRGNIVLEPESRTIFDIIDGFAVVRQGDKFGIISVDGSWTLEPTFDDNLRLQPGRIAVFSVEGGEFPHPFSGTSNGIIDVHGNVIAEPIYSTISNFYDNVAVVSLSKGLGYWYEGLMYIDGSWVVEPVRHAIFQSTSRGLVAFSFDRLQSWGFMNTQGEIVIEARYAHIGWDFLRVPRGNQRDYIVVFDVFEEYFSYPCIHHSEAPIAVFQYRVIDLTGNTVYVDSNVYKIYGVSRSAANSGNISAMAARVRDGVNYRPVIVNDNTETSMFDPNGFYTLTSGDFLLVADAEPIEVIVLDENLQFEWVPVHSNS